MAHRFHLMTDEQLAAHIGRLESLANTSEETDEYAALMGKLDSARAEQDARALARLPQEIR